MSNQTPGWQPPGYNPPGYTPPPPPSTPPPGAGGPPSYTPPPPPSYGGGPGGYPPSGGGPSKSKAPLIIGAVVVGVVVLGAILALVLAGGGDDDEETGSTTTVETTEASTTDSAGTAGPPSTETTTETTEPEETTTTGPADLQPAEVPDGFVAVTDDAAGFGIVVPDDWMDAPAQEGSVLARNNANDSAAVLVNVQANSAPGGVLPPALADNIPAGLESTGFTGVAVEPVTINDKDALVATAENAGGFQIYQGYIPGAEDLYLVTLSFASIQDDPDVAMTILESFRGR